MTRLRLAATWLGFLAGLTVVSPPVAAQARPPVPYYPSRGDWEHRRAAQVGLSPKAVDDAVALALANESTTPRDLLEAHRASFGREPFGEAVGPFRTRGGAAGLIVRHGYIVAEWGDPDRADQTFSVTKSFVTTTVGLAFDRKMIRAVTDPVRGYMAPIVALKGPPGARPPLARIPATSVNGADTLAGGGLAVAYDAFEVLDPFESEHNRKITWEHLLRQTSDWQGTLWGKPDWADRFPRNATDTAAVINRRRDEPGAVYKYNDVRVNLLALASLNVWRRPLPQVLKEYVMDPVGASDTWRWLGYDNSWVLMDGALVQSVAGGGHWGGGMVISARDMARFGLLTLHAGRWRNRQLISAKWIQMSRSPGAANTQYGYANYFLNTGRKALPNAPEPAFYHLGNGNNIIYVDPVNDLVIVARWMNSTRTLDAMIRLLVPAK